MAVVLAALAGGCADANEPGGVQRDGLQETSGVRPVDSPTVVQGTLQRASPIQGEGEGDLDEPTPTPIPSAPSTPAPTPRETDAPEQVVPEPVPTPAPAPEQPPEPYPSTEPPPAIENDVVSIIHEVFGPNAGAALAVAWCESRFNPDRVGAAGERGLFQIHPIHWDWLDEDLLFDPLYNAQMAFQLSKGCTEDGVCGPGGSDWSSWSCQP